MSHTPIDIRLATEADASVLANHRMSMFRDMGTAQPAIEDELLAASSDAIRDAMRSGEYVAWIAHLASDPEHVVGGAGVQLRRLLPRPDADGTHVLIGLEGIVLNVYVDPDFRGRGVARRLMETIIAWAPTVGIVRLVLHASKQGRSLYESLGFEQTNEMRYGRPLGKAT